ncbi:MAG: hypothetical protein AB7I36_00805 [Rhodospirillaceae bacterium]
MEALSILGAWIAVVLGVDLAVIRPWKSPAARAALPLLFGAALVLWVLGSGFVTYRQMMTDGAWTGASITMAFVPAKAIALSLLAYAAGRCFLTARATPAAPVGRWALPALLAGVIIYAVGTDITGLRGAALERQASNPAISDAQVLMLVQKIRAGDAARGEIAAFLGNPKCPSELLAEYAASAEPYWRTAVARNDAIDPALAGKLAGDPDEMVRLYLAFNRELPADILTRLASDSSDSVRDIVVWTDGLPEESFERLVNDPSAKVRATAALQPRLSKSQIDRLRGDPEQRVRDAVNRRHPE